MATPLWITGLAPPDSRAVAAPSRLPTATGGSVSSYTTSRGTTRRSARARYRGGGQLASGRAGQGRNMPQTPPLCGHPLAQHHAHGVDRLTHHGVRQMCVFQRRLRVAMLERACR